MIIPLKVNIGVFVVDEDARETARTAIHVLNTSKQMIGQVSEWLIKGLQ